MKLRLPHYQNELVWNNDNYLNEIVIENRNYYRQIATDFFNHQEDGTGLSLTFHGNPIEFKKQVSIIDNPCHLEFNSKTILGTLLKNVQKTSVSEDYYLETNQLKTRISHYILQLIEETQYNFCVDVDDDFTLEQIAKCLSIKVNLALGNIVDQLVDYLEIMHSLSDTRLHVFLNLNAYLSQPEIKNLSEHIQQREINALFVNSWHSTVKVAWPKIIIDEDLCEI